MPNYPNNEVEREVRSRVNGAMEELIRKRNSELRELAASKYAPGPGMGSGPYEQMRVGVSISFYEALFQKIEDCWVDVLTRHNGKISASDVSHVVQELEMRASAAPTHIRRALASRGATVYLLPPGAMKALEDGARRRMNELVAKHRRELQTRLYNQDHPHPREVPPVPNMNITKINSDNVNSTVTSGHAIRIGPAMDRKGRWETWWGTSTILVATGVIAGLIIWGITRHFDRPPLDTGASAERKDGKTATVSVPSPATESDRRNGLTPPSGSKAQLATSTRADGGRATGPASHVQLAPAEPHTAEEHKVATQEVIDARDKAQSRLKEFDSATTGSYSITVLPAELKWRALLVSRLTLDFLVQRESAAPPYPPPGADAAESTKAEAALRTYDAETIREFKRIWGSSVGEVRVALAAKGLQDRTLDELYDHPINWVGIRIVAEKVGDLAEKLPPDPPATGK